MKIFLAAFAVMVFWEIRGMLKGGQKREIVVFVCLAAVGLALGVWFFSDPFRDSFTSILF